MKVWIDAELCTGVALCERACPDVFAMAGDGVAHVKDGAGTLQPSRTMVPFADGLLEAVIEAAEDCPEECIFIEP